MLISIQICRYSRYRYIIHTALSIHRVAGLVTGVWSPGGEPKIFFCRNTTYRYRYRYRYIIHTTVSVHRVAGLVTGVSTPGGEPKIFSIDASAAAYHAPKQLDAEDEVDSAKDGAQLHAAGGVNARVCIYIYITRFCILHNKQFV